MKTKKKKVGRPPTDWKQRHDALHRVCNDAFSELDAAVDAIVEMICFSEGAARLFINTALMKIGGER